MKTSMDNQPEEIARSFDWAIYADATLAGLSVLIPIPFLDSLTEDYFRNRMVRAIAQRRGEQLHPLAEATVNCSQQGILSFVGGCLIWPFRFVIDLVLRLSRKILYFLTVKKAIDSLNRYWQRAYLLDYMVLKGYLADAEHLEAATKALELVLKIEGTSPLTRLASEIVKSPGRLIQSVRRAQKKGEEDTKIQEARTTMSQSWNRYDDYFRRLQGHFEVAYQNERSFQTSPIADPVV